MKFRDSTFHAILKEDLARFPNGTADLDSHVESSLRFLEAIPPARLGHAYAPGKWTVAEVVGHLLDARMVFLGRILYIARGDAVPLPGFDEQTWVKNAGYSAATLQDLAGLYRDGSRVLGSMLRTLPAGALDREGLANGIAITAGEIVLYLMAHERHHLRVLSERYLAGVEGAREPAGRWGR